jgi:hypothetical protein
MTHTQGSSATGPTGASRTSSATTSLVPRASYLVLLTLLSRLIFLLPYEPHASSFHTHTHMSAASKACQQLVKQVEAHV